MRGHYGKPLLYIAYSSAVDLGAINNKSITKDVSSVSVPICNNSEYSNYLCVE